MGKPLVSCIVPVYNSEGTIADCLESVLALDYSPLEVLIVDDGSTDRSIDAIQDFIRLAPREGPGFTLLQQRENRGISSAKNLGMSRMQGEYFFFAGSDDLQSPSRISSPLSYLLQNPRVDIVYSDCDLWHEARGRDASVKRGFPEGMTNENAFLFQLNRSYLWSGALFARRSARLDFDESLSSAVDYDWYFNQYFHGRIIHFIDESLARYRLHDRNTSKKLSRSRENVVRILQKYDFGKAYSYMVAQNQSANLHLAFASVDLTLGRFSEALEKLSLASVDSMEKDFMTGVAQASMGQHEWAMKTFRSLCDRSPELPECLNNLACCLVSSGDDHEEALTLLNRAIQLNPDYLDAQNNLLLLSSDRAEFTKLSLTRKPLRSRLTHLETYN